MKQSGIYEIVNTANGKRYVGSAACFKTRFAVTGRPCSPETRAKISAAQIKRLALKEPT